MLERAQIMKIDCSITLPSKLKIRNKSFPSLGMRRSRSRARITDEPFMLGPSGPTIAFIEDPDGTLIELIERK